MPAESVEQHYVDGFVANLALAPQQTTARLVTCVDADLSYSKPGKMFNADDIEGDDDEEDIVARAPPTPDGWSEHVRRVGFFLAKGKGKWLDNIDVARMLQDPANVVMQGIMATKNRGTDDAIIATLFAAAREGETGETTVAYNTTNQQIAADSRTFLHASEASVVAGSGDLPLTVGKLILAKNKLDKSELAGPRYFAAGSDQLSNLLSSTAATSGDYNTIKALVNGETNSFMGFEFVRTERLPLAATIRSCAAWIKSAVQYKERPIVNAKIAQRADRSYRWQAYYEVERGGVRRYDAGVVKVLCKEA
ncbi:phage capsid protein [Phenylobacterium sp.]|uniref:phage capsid protein n=1 Tax=Phenylobacterium sp. TaxID=1871053 RepID=UPI002FCA0E09